MDARGGLGVNVGFRWVFSVDAVPPLDHFEVFEGQESVEVGEHELLDFFAEERVDVKAVFVGVADGEAAVFVATDEEVDAPFFVVRQFAVEPFEQGRELFADAEIGVVAEGESRAEVGLEIVIGLARAHTEHLEFAAGDAEGLEMVGEEGFEVVAGSEDDLVGADGFASGEDLTAFDLDSGGAEAKFDAERCEVCGEFGDDLAGEDAELVGAPHCAEEVVLPDSVGFVGDFAGRDDFAAIAGLGSLVNKFREYGEFVFVIGEVERAGFTVPNAGGVEDFLPNLAAAEGRFAKFTGRLADGPDHAEVANRCPLGALSTLNDDDPQARASEVVGVGEADDSGSDDGDIKFFGILHVS